MYKYIVIELQTMTDGSVGNLVYSFDTEDEAWSKYFAVLSSAATSKLPRHAATLLQSDGYQVAYREFTHKEAE